MLTLLHIENIAVIEQADVRLDGGFTVLTGETGAGKSIIIDSIGTILGQKTNREIIRTGAAKAFVSGVFACIEPQAQKLLAELGIEANEDGEIILSREITDTRSLCRVNDRPVSSSLLREAGMLLVNILGQHENLRLINENTHLSFLDAYSKSNDCLSAYKSAYTRYCETKSKLESINDDENERSRRADMLRFQVSQIEKAGIVSGEEEKLLERRRVLQNAEKLSGIVERVSEELLGGEESGGASGNTRNAAKELLRCSDNSQRVRELSDELYEMSDRIRDIANEVFDMTAGADYSLRELDSIEERLETISKLKRRYGATADDIIKYCENAKDELDNIENAQDRIKELENELKLRAAEAKAAASRLTAQRSAAAKMLESDIMRELSYLDMQNAVFSVKLDGKELSSDGADSCVFLISVNRGESAKSLTKVASGGELSRIMLAMQTILSAGECAGTFVFDEVDTGISGRAAQRIAERLATVSRNKQVVCVTHSNLVAAMADEHLLISKSEHGGRTYTEIAKLGEKGRETELSRLVSGDNTTGSSIENARELLRAAADYKAAL